MAHHFSILLASLLAAAAASAQAPMAGYWTFDETSGLVASDLGPYGNHGTLSGFGANGLWVSGQSGNALQFDGVDDHVQLATNGGLPIYRGNGTPFSVCFWVKAPPGEDLRVYSEGRSTANTGPLFTLGTGRTSRGTGDKFHLYIRNDAVRNVANIDSTLTVFDDTWHHVAYVDVAGDAKLYVDGTLDPSSFDYRFSIRGTLTADYGTYSTDTVSVGAVLRSSSAAHLQGTVDELVIFESALSAADVQLVMSGALPSIASASMGKFGVGCSAGTLDISGTGSAAFGSSFTFQLASGAPGAAALLSLGFAAIAPFDLSSLGYPGCTLYGAGPLFISIGALGNTGSSLPFTFGVPTIPALQGFLLNFQGVSVDLTSTLDLSPAFFVQLGA